MAFALPLQNHIDSMRFSHETHYPSIKLATTHWLVEMAKKMFPVMQEQMKHGTLTQKLYHATDTITCIVNKYRV